MKIEIVYCDHCGEIVRAVGDPMDPRNNQEKPHRTYARLPWDINSANKGESGVVCKECVYRLNEEAVQRSEGE